MIVVVPEIVPPTSSCLEHELANIPVNTEQARYAKRMKETKITMFKGLSTANIVSRFNAEAICAAAPCFPFIINVEVNAFEIRKPVTIPTIIRSV